MTLLSSLQVLELCAFDDAMFFGFLVRDTNRNLVSTDQNALNYILINEPDNPCLGSLCFNLLLVLSYFFHACQYDWGNTESLTSSPGRRLRISNSSRRLAVARCEVPQMIFRGAIVAKCLPHVRHLPSACE